MAPRKKPVVQFAYPAHNKDLVPTKAHKNDAGYDLRAAQDTVVASRSYAKINIGGGIILPTGYYGLIEGRSGLASIGVFPIGGVIDAEYTGDVEVILLNASRTPLRVSRGDRIAQIILYAAQDFEVQFSEERPETERGDAGFGSTGK